MLLLADLLDLRYWMEEETKNGYIVFVEVVPTGETGTFLLPHAGLKTAVEKLESNLDRTTESRVLEELGRSSKNFKQYWNDSKNKR